MSENNHKLFVFCLKIFLSTNAYSLSCCYCYDNTKWFNDFM